MAKKKTTPGNIGITPETKVELVMTKGDKSFLKEMENQEALKALAGKHPIYKKKPGWVFRIYQIGTSQFQNITKL